MTNRDRLIEALRGTAPDAVCRHVLSQHICCPYEGLCEKDFGAYERNPEEMCIKCKENWLSQELDFEMEGLTNV